MKKIILTPLQLNALIEELKRIFGGNYSSKIENRIKKIVKKALSNNNVDIAVESSLSIDEITEAAFKARSNSIQEKDYIIIGIQVVNAKNSLISFALDYFDNNSFFQEKNDVLLLFIRKMAIFV